MIKESVLMDEYIERLVIIPTGTQEVMNAIFGMVPLKFA